MKAVNQGVAQIRARMLLYARAYAVVDEKWDRLEKELDQMEEEAKSILEPLMNLLVVDALEDPTEDE